MQDFQDLIDLRPLCIFGDDLAAEDVFPSQEIPPTSAAGQYLLKQGLTESQIGTLQDHLTNDEMVKRGSFSGGSLKNLMTSDVRGSYTQYYGDAILPPIDQKIAPSRGGRPARIFDAAFCYRQSGRSLVIIAGDSYGGEGTWEQATKGTSLLGVKAVIAKSFHRHYSSDLRKNGILPLTFAQQEEYSKVAPMHSCIFSITRSASSSEEATLTASCGFQCSLITQTGE